MDPFSRPATLEDLKVLLRSLNDHSGEYLLIGGYALAAHGYQRATTGVMVGTDHVFRQRPARLRD